MMLENRRRDSTEPLSATPRAAAVIADGRRACILEEDQELAAHIPKHHRQRVGPLFSAPVIQVACGAWAIPLLDPATTYGLLLLDGLVGRRVALVNATAMEILGPGDIMRPWDDPSLTDAVDLQAGWEILRAARFAVLDERITALIARWPTLSVALSGRLLRRAQRLTFLLAVSHLSRIEDRLLATLWFLAASWGRVTPDGMTVPINLTHQALGEIAGAQRSSVTLAMASLRRRRLVIRHQGGTYVVCGEPPHMAASALRSARVQAAG